MRLPEDLAKLSIPGFIIVLALNAAPVLAEFGPKELEAKIKEAKILPEGDRISSVIHGDEALVSKYKPASADDKQKNCKIEAILIGKEVMSAASNIKKVRVRFFERLAPSKYSEILVSAADIKAFAVGAISQDDLLASLDITSGTDHSSEQSLGSQATPASTTASQPSTEPGVQAGPLKEKRQRLLAQINVMQGQGANTSAFSKQFEIIENLAKSGDAEATAAALDKLTASVNDQQKIIDQRVSAIDTAATAANASKNEKPLTFIAERGPFQSERNYIACVLSQRQDKGIAVKQFVPIQTELNFYARRKDAATVRSKINTAYSYLRIPSLRDYMRNLPLSVAGQWTSDWGPVVLVVDSYGAVRGYWIQDGQRGTIKSGTFNPATRVLDFSYYTPIESANGTCRLFMSADRYSLSGRWSQNGQTGTWTMTRVPGT